MNKIYDADNILNKMPISTMTVIALSLALLLLFTTFVNSTHTYAQTLSTDKLLDKALRSLTLPTHVGYSYDSQQEKILYEPWTPSSK